MESKTAASSTVSSGTTNNKFAKWIDPLTTEQRQALPSVVALPDNGSVNSDDDLAVAMLLAQHKAGTINLVALIAVHFGAQERARMVQFMVDSAGLGDVVPVYMDKEAARRAEPKDADKFRAQNSHWPAAVFGVPLEYQSQEQKDKGLKIWNTDFGKAYAPHVDHERAFEDGVQPLLDLLCDSRLVSPAKPLRVVLQGPVHFLVRVMEECRRLAEQDKLLTTKAPPADASDADSSSEYRIDNLGIRCTIRYITLPTEERIPLSYEDCLRRLDLYGMQGGLNGPDSSPQTLAAKLPERLGYNLGVAINDGTLAKWLSLCAELGATKGCRLPLVVSGQLIRDQYIEMSNDDFDRIQAFAAQDNAPIGLKVFALQWFMTKSGQMDTETKRLMVKKPLSDPCVVALACGILKPAQTVMVAIEPDYKYLASGAVTSFLDKTSAGDPPHWKTSTIAYQDGSTRVDASAAALRPPVQAPVQAHALLVTALSAVGSLQHPVAHLVSSVHRALVGAYCSHGV